MAVAEDVPELGGDGSVFYDLHLGTLFKHFILQRAVPQQADAANEKMENGIFNYLDGKPMAASCLFHNTGTSNKYKENH